MSAQNPVFLVHGIDDTAVLFDKMSALLRRGGRPVYALNLVPNNGDAGLDELVANEALWSHPTIGGVSPAGRKTILTAILDHMHQNCRYTVQAGRWKLYRRSMSAKIALARASLCTCTKYSLTHVTRWSLNVPLMTW